MPSSRDSHMSDGPNQDRARYAAPGRVLWLHAKSRLTRLAWIPIPVLLVAMAILWAGDLRTAYETPRLLMTLNFVFSTVASLFVAYLIGRSFLVRGRPGLLMLGCRRLRWP